MAYLAGSGNGTPPGVSATASASTASASTSSGINSEQLNLAQLMALMQQQQSTNSTPTQTVQPSAPINQSNQNNLYQQLLIQNQLQQQIPQPTAQTASGLSLVQLQQLAASLQQPSAPTIPALNPTILQLAGQQSQLNNFLAAFQQQQIQQQQMNPTTALLNTLLNTLQSQANFQQLAPALNLLAGQTAPQQTTTIFGNTLPTQTDESKALLEYYLRQQQQQQELAAMMAAASVNQTPRSSLSTQNSSNSLLGQPGHIQNHGSRTSAEAVYVSIPSSTSSTSGAPHSSNLVSTETGSGCYQSSTTHQASSERLLTSAQSVEDHIARLISENAAIVEPNPVLLKRRPYNRQNTSSSITSNTGNNDQTGSTQGSPGLGSPGQTPISKIPTTRSQSLHEPAILSTLRMTNGSLTSGQPIIRGERILACSACGVKFPNEIGLEMHQNRCGKKDMLLKQHSQPQLLLHTHTSTAFQTPQQLLLQQQKSQAEHEARISALIGGGAGVPSDFTIQTNTGRSSVPVGTGTSGSLMNSPPLTQQVISSSDSNSRKGSIQNLYPTERQQSKKRLFENKIEDYIDVVTVNESQPESPGSNTSSINASKSEPMDTDTAPAKMAKIPFCEPSTSSCLDLSSVIPTSTFHVASNFITNTAIVDPVYELPPESKATQEMVQLQLAFYERRLEPMPYVVTYVNQNDMPPIVDNDVNAAVNRRMLKTLTNCSKVCDTIPHCRILQTGESHFSLYKQAIVLDEQVQQLFQYLACYSAKPRTNVKRHCIYTIADKTSGAHPNHSRAVPTFISHSKQPTNVSKLSCPTIVIPFHTQNLPDPVMLTSAPASCQYLAKPNPIKQIKSEIIRYANNTDELESNKKSFPGAEYAAIAAKIKPISGGRSEEVEVYVRGRGRGRYVCDRCGIKCKKPSMLKKHLKSHTNIRPFICITCNFGFKTKGNLTKHLFSKAHRRKLEEQGHEQTQSPRLTIIDEDDENIIKNEDNAKIEKRILMESQFFDNDDEEIDEETFGPIVEAMTYRRFGQENIIYERETHTPPTLWTLCAKEDKRTWPEPDLDRSCHSAPPVYEFEKEKKQKKNTIVISTASTSTQALPQTEPNIGCIVIQQMMKDGSKFAESVSKGDQEAQMQFTNEVVRMSRAIGSTGFMLPVVKRQEILEPISRKRPYPINSSFENGRKASFSTFISSESFNCDQCDKKFRKESELNLHKKTHLIEKQIKTSRAAKSCQCPECKTIMRSKAVLTKHMETVHPGIKLKLLSETESSISTMNINGLLLNEQIGISSTSSSTKINMTIIPATGRSFICTDCNLGFRTHGVLAKHLRTKNHVKALCAAGKLPEDSLTIIRDNSSVLANVDASDCESARISLFEIIGKLRKSNDSLISLIPLSTNIKINSSINSLECTEELSSISPTPRLPEQNFRLCDSSPVMKNVPTNLQKRLADESANPITIKRRHLNISPETRQTFSGNGLLGASQMNFAQHNHQQRYSISDIWIPPKIEDLENSGIKSSNIFPIVERSTTDENLSDTTTSRSETSTPQQKSMINVGIKLTRCQLCNDEFENSCDLQVHFQSEHICMRDGSYFQCPNSNCEKVYPSKNSLRNHLFTHYRSGTFIESPIIDRDDEFSPSTNQSAINPEDILSNGGVANPTGMPNRKDSKTAHTAPKHSPGAPEESHTLIGIKVEQQNIENLNSKNKIEKPILKCNQCQLIFINADKFQQHCIIHSNRPHICKKCDAGFTSIEALKIHAIGHT